MDWSAIVSSMQIIFWSLNACFLSAGIFLLSMVVSGFGFALVSFLIVPSWIRMWNNVWYPIEAISLNFILALITFFCVLVAMGSTHLDDYLESLIATARKEASAPFAEWRQVGFPQGLNVLDVGTDVCAVLQKQARPIQEGINRQEPFRSWPDKRFEPIPIHCEMVRMQLGKTVRRDDERFNANFNNAFEVIEQHFKQSKKGLASKVRQYILWGWGGCFILILLYFSKMAYCDIKEYHNPP